MDAMQQSRQSCPARLLPLPSCPLVSCALVLWGLLDTSRVQQSRTALYTRRAHKASYSFSHIRTLTLSSWPWRPHTTSSPRPTRVRDASPLERENQHKTYIAALSAQSSTIPPASAPGQRASRAALMVPRADAMTGSDPLDDLIRLSISGASDVIGMQRARRPRSRQRHPSALASRTRALVELSHIQFLVIPALTVCVCSCAHETPPPTRHTIQTHSATMAGPLARWLLAALLAALCMSAAIGIAGARPSCAVPHDVFQLLLFHCHDFYVLLSYGARALALSHTFTHTLTLARTHLLHM